MYLNLAKTPFSKYGSFIGIEQHPTLGITIRCVRQEWDRGRVFSLVLSRNGAPVTPEITATPAAVELHAGPDAARLYLQGDDSLVIAARGLEVTLVQLGPGFVFPEGDRQYKLHYADGQLYTRVEAVRGEITAEYERYIADDGIQRVGRTAVKITGDGGEALVRATISTVEQPVPASPVRVDEDIAAVQAEWDAFRACMPAVPAARAGAAELAWYTLWSCTVRAGGQLTYDAILMSMAHMCAMWSWDHCFNALAIAHASLPRAIEQWLLPFELQQPTGQLPDRWSVSNSSWLINKPPVHGWCIQRLLAAGAIEPALLRKIYQRLAQWTTFWFDYRDTDGDGIPNYIQGCDSGWDNSTLFDPGICPEAPDLSAFLVLQLHALADIAARLGDHVAAAGWRGRADALLQRLYAHSWTADGFVAKVSGAHTYDPHPTSLLILMPLVLGERLDPEKFALLADRLERDFLTENGPATEAPRSPLYMPDGYWRGPIWAPSTYLLVDGLRRGGRADLAKEIARRFCDMAERAGGDYENYDALTGAGLRCQAYTWTAAVNLLLMHEYLR